MKRINAEDLYPMQVSPLNFTKGDVVKKSLGGENMTSPYVGVVTSVIPSTNKVEVQWPMGVGLEEPWDLIKVNPLINPPVVREDKSYNTYENQKAKKYNEDYCDDLQHYSVLNDYIVENMMPLLMRASSYYNNGLSKKQAFINLKKASDHKDMVSNVINRLYNDNINLVRSNVVEINGEAREASLSISGNSDSGFEVTYKLGNNSEKSVFESYQDAFENFKGYESILANLDNKPDYKEIVAKVSNLLKEEKVTTVGTVKEHVETIKASENEESETIKLADLDDILANLHKSMQE